MTIDIEKVGHDIAKTLAENGFFRRLCADCRSSNVVKTGEKSESSLTFSLRGDCHSLVEDIAQTWGIEQREIYTALIKKQGVSQPKANPEQLSERVDILRDWLENGVVK